MRLEHEGEIDAEAVLAHGADEIVGIEGVTGARLVEAGVEARVALEQLSVALRAHWPGVRDLDHDSPPREDLPEPLRLLEDRADRLSMYATLFDDPDFVNRMLPRYLSVTPEAILEVAAATFRPDNRLVLTYLPEGRPADSDAVDPDTAETSAEEVAA